MRLDSHQHFWQYQADEYAWISDDLRILQQDYMPAYLEPILRDNGMAGTIAIQARQSLTENTFLCDLQTRHDFIKGVVGWLPLASDDLSVALDTWGPNLSGVRHILHDEPDISFMLSRDFQRGVSRLSEHNLAYDLLVRPEHLENCLRLVDAFPDQRFVIDHLAKPLIATGEIDAWRQSMAALAQRPQVYCKLSGMVTEADFSQWGDDEVPLDTFTPYMDAALEAFSPARVMFGSDWPVCTLAATYDEVYDIVVSYIHSLSREEQADVMGETATRFYAIS